MKTVKIGLLGLGNVGTGTYQILDMNREQITKSTGLNDAIKYIKNFVSEKTIIISLINGISSEEKIKQAFPKAKVLRSYFIGHSAMREASEFKQDGVGKIVFTITNNSRNYNYYLAVCFSLHYKKI